MKDKAKSDCEGFEGQAQTIANPRKDEKAAKKERKRLERKRAEITRGNALAKLLTREQITKHMYEAGQKLRGLYVRTEPGARAVDFTKPKVDGGGPRRDGMSLDLVAARKELDYLLLVSGMGVDAARVVHMLCAMDMMPTLIAIEIEPDDSIRANEQCSRETLRIVRYLLRSGLEKTWKAMNSKGPSRFGAGSQEFWLSDHALATFEATLSVKDRGTRG